MNQVFDINRLMLLARLKFSLHKKVLLLSAMGFFALLFFIGFFVAYGNRKLHDAEIFQVFHYISMSIMMVLGGVILAGRSFQDMNTKEKSTLQLMIPASTLEKYTLSLVSTSLIWIIVSFLAYHLFSILFNGVWALTFGYEFELFNGFRMFDVFMISEILFGFLFLHSMFFLGASAFKKHPIVKTILAKFIINWAYGFLGIICILIFFGSFQNFGIKMESLDEIVMQKSWFDMETLEYRSRLILRTFTILLSAAFYVTAYYKLKEREV